LGRVAAFGSDISAGLLSPILIGGDFLKDLLFELVGNFRLSTRTWAVNNIAINNKRICSRIPAIINSFCKQILEGALFNQGNALDVLEGGSYSFHGQGLSPSRELMENHSWYSKIQA